MAENDIGYEKRLQAGETLFNEGDKGDKMYLIKIGKIRIVKELEGKSKTLAILDDGAFFGEMAVLDNRPRSAAAIAETDVELIIVNREALLDKVRENPFIKFIISTLTQRLRRVNEMWLYHGVPNDRVRFIRYLKHRAKRNDTGTGINIDTGILPDIEEISVTLALQPSEIEDCLEQLKKDKLIKVDETIIIDSMEKLNEYEESIPIQEEFERIKEFEDMISLCEEFEL